MHAADGRERAREIIQHVLGLFPAEEPVAFQRHVVGSDTASSEWYSGSAERIRAACAKRPLFVGVFANQDAADVNRIATDAGLDLIQLSGHEGMDRAGDHVLPIIKAVHVGADTTLDQLEATFEEGRPHSLLLDTKSPSSPSMMGGTGEVFDWSLAQAASKTTPLFLAGGLSPENIFDAVAKVTPFAVDVSSGVEKSKGVKCLDKIAQFVSEAKRKL